MKRKKANKTPDQNVEASGFVADYSPGRVYKLIRSLQRVHDEVEMLDNQTYNAIDGSQLMDDLDIHIRQLSTMVKTIS